MNKERYVSYGIAKLLKEKGFCEENIYCYYQGEYENDSTDVWRGECKFNWNIYDDSYSAPTQQMVMAWLREEHKIFISIGVGTDIDGVFGYMPSIYFLSILSCNEGRFVPNVDADDICNSTPQTYEDAVEAALEYVLKNLI